MRLAATALALLPLLAIACGSSGGDGLSELPQDFSYGGSSAKSDAGKGDNGGGDTNGGGVLGGGSTGSSDMDAGPIVPGTPATTSTCNSVSAKATLPPVKLVVMLDKSGSMGGDDLASKWTPVTKALEAFFADPTSTGMSASLQFFPQDSGECNVSSYSTQAVPFTDLPSTGFTSAISHTSPDGETPTNQALTGALEYASMTRSTDTSGAVYAAVLVTDGDPNGCGASTNEASAKVVGATAATYATATNPLLTYVIGVGQDTTYLNDIATGGGTTSAQIVSTTTPAATTSANLIAALNKIRTASIGCSYPIPAPPSGQTYDANAVNVNYTSSTGAMQTLPYDPNCTGAGWHYDDPNSPAQIVLCTTTCSEVKAGTGGSIDVAFGCATAGTPPIYADGGTVPVIR